MLIDRPKMDSAVFDRQLAPILDVSAVLEDHTAGSEKAIDDVADG